MSKTGGSFDVASAPTIALPSLRLTPGGVIADRYEILAPLGEGGMGAVFRVLDRELREEIALKALRPEIADEPGMLDRFRREVKLARRVTHPNVARTFDLGAYQGVRFLTMELVPGESVARRWARGKRAPLPEALRIAAEVARGLSAAHAVGVIHRDLKPDNVLLHNDRVVITDFGIARQEQGGINATRTVGAIVGTPAYMAPEQLEGRDICGRTDVYALGLMLFELLTGTSAFEGDTLYALAAARLAGEAPDPRKRDASIPEPVAQLVSDMISRQRNDRPDAQMVVTRVDTLRGAAAALPERTPRLPSAAFDMTPREPRQTAVLPLIAVDESARALAAELSEALGDAVSGMRGVRIIPAARVRQALTQPHGGDDEPIALGKKLDAGMVVEGSVRVVGNRVRARVRLVDVERGAVAWAERVEGNVEDPFALEDDLVRGVTEAIAARESFDAARGGPADKRVREIYDEARIKYGKFGTSFSREAIVILEKGLEKHPGDAWLTSLLGAAIARVWLQTGSRDRDLIARAEELSLRALATDPTIGETFHTIGVLRIYEGDVRAAVRAFNETLTRAPLHAEAHQNLGKTMIETGFVEEGMKRLDLAQRLDPNLLLTTFEIARTRALLGDRPGAIAALEEAVQKGGEMASVFPRLRLLIWWRDRELAALTASILERSNTGAQWERALPMAQALARGEYWAGAEILFPKLADDARGAPKHRAFMYELAAEYYGAFDRRELCLDALERAAELPMIDVFWMDKCPTLDCVRDDPRFARARATVAARAAAVWS
jgi:eukaryotic-like serine/threonine-protein kinase